MVGLMELEKAVQWEQYLVAYSADSMALLLVAKLVHDWNQSLVDLKGKKSDSKSAKQNRTPK